MFYGELFLQMVDIICFIFRGLFYFRIFGYTYVFIFDRIIYLYNKYLGVQNYIFQIFVYYVCNIRSK